MKTPTNPKGSGRKLSGKTLLRFWTFPDNKEKIKELIKKLEDEK